MSESRSAMRMAGTKSFPQKSFQMDRLSSSSESRVWQAGSVGCNSKIAAHTGADIEMPISALTETIAQTTTIISLVATGLFGLAWVIGSLLKGSMIPWRDWKEFGNSLQTDAIKSTFLMAMYSSIASLIAWVVNVIATAG